MVILAIGGSSSRFGGALFDNNGAAVVQGTQKDISIDSDLVRKIKKRGLWTAERVWTAVHFLFQVIS